MIPLSTQHYPVLQRNLVYTGVTRGKRLVVVVGQRKALAIAVKGARARDLATVEALRATAEAEAEHGRDDEESGLALGREKTDHGKTRRRSCATRRSGRPQGPKPAGSERRGRASIESIAAPADAEIPRSVHRATR